MKVKRESEVIQLCLTLRNPMDCSLPGSSIRGIFQARVLEWVAIAFSEYTVNWDVQGLYHSYLLNICIYTTNNYGITPVYLSSLTDIWTAPWIESKYYLICSYFLPSGYPFLLIICHSCRIILTSQLNKMFSVNYSWHLRIDESVSWILSVQLFLCLQKL